MNVSRAILLISFTAAITLPGRRASADDTSSFYALLSFGSYYAADRWTPVQFVVRNQTNQSREGYCELPLGNPIGSLSIRVPIRVPPFSSESVIGYTFFPEQPPLRSKAAQIPPLTIAQWISNGKREGRTEILGRSVGAAGLIGRNPSSSGGDSRGRLVLIANGPNPPTLPPSLRHRVPYEQTQLLAASTDPDPMINAAESLFPERFVAASVFNPSLPRSSVGYDCVAMVVAQDLPPDLLDPAQRQALLEYVRGGGVLILPDPPADCDPTDSWLSPYLPVRVIGHRVASALQASAPSLSTSVPIAEAVADDSQPAQIHLCLQESNYIDAAYRNVGLGRVVFTSFPLGALDPKDDRTVSLWRALLGDLQRPHDWDNVPLGKQDGAMLQQLIGHAAAPWTAAAGVAGLYAAIVALLQLALRGTRRPIAFLASLGVALLGCGGLLAANSLHHRDQTLTGARLTTMDIASSGGGLQQESLACLGPDDLDVALHAAPQSWVKPEGQEGHAGGGPAVTIDTAAFRIPSIGVSSGRIDHIWRAAGPIAPGYNIISHGQFDKDGFHLLSKNNLGSALHSPLLIYGPTRYSLPDIPAGDGTLVPGAQNLTPGDYSYGSSMETEVSRFRAQMLASAFQQTFAFSERPTGAPTAIIAGWLESTAKPELIALDPPAALREQTLVRSEVLIDPSSPGEMVHIDAGFNALTAGPLAIPYNFNAGQWESVSQAQNWLIAFAPPAEIGTVRMIHATLVADMAAPGHIISIRRGQCIAGHVHDNFNGPLVAQWDRLTASRSVDIECADSDLDANGWLWLRLSVQMPEGSMPRPGVLWRFNSLGLNCDAQVTGPPQPAKITWDLPIPRKPVIGSKPPQKKPPAKKPTTKPTTKPRSATN